MTEITNEQMVDGARTRLFSAQGKAEGERGALDILKYQLRLASRDWKAGAAAVYLNRAIAELEERLANSDRNVELGAQQLEREIGYAAAAKEAAGL